MLCGGALRSKAAADAQAFRQNQLAGRVHRYLQHARIPFCLSLTPPCRGGAENYLIDAKIFLPARQTVFAHQSVALDAKPVDLVLHPLQQRIRRHRADPRSLKALDFLPLPQDLPPHVLNFVPDVVETYGNPRFAC